MTATLNTLPVTRCLLTMPQSGVWLADCEVATTSMQNAVEVAVVPSDGSAVSLVIDAQTLVGTVTYSDDRINGRLTARVCGGLSGGYVATPKAVHFVGGSVKLVVSTLLSSVGETLNTTLSDNALLTSRLPSWQTFGDRTLAEEMTQLAQHMGCSWRVDPKTGGAYLVTDTFSSAASMPTDAVIEEVSEAAFSTWLCPALDVLPAPGTTDGAGGNDIVEVFVDLDHTHTRLQLRSLSMASMLSNPTTDRGIELNVGYGGQVTAQNGDGTVNINPDLPSLKGNLGLSSVRVMSGPGLSAQLTPGTRVTFIFQNADPSLSLVVQAAQSPLPQSVQLNAQTLVNLGDASDFVVLATPYEALLTALTTFCTGLAPTTVAANGAALKTALGVLPTPATVKVKAS